MEVYKPYPGFIDGMRSPLRGGERAEEVEFLMAAGCDFGQGDHFDIAHNAADFANAWRARPRQADTRSDL